MSFKARKGIDLGDGFAITTKRATEAPGIYLRGPSGAISLPDSPGTTITQTFSTAEAVHANRTSAALTDNSGGAAASGTIPAPTVRLCGFTYLQNVAAKVNDDAADQYDVSGGNGTMANLVQPDVPRNIKMTMVDAAAADIDAFTVTVTGTDMNGVANTEVFVFAGGLVQTGVVVFASLTSVILTDINNHAASDTLDVGWQDNLGVPIPADATSFSIVKLVAAGTDESPAAEDATNNSFRPSTAPDGAKDFEVWYEYLAVAQGSADATAELVDQINKVRADLADTAAVLNSVIDSLQTSRILG